jgi:hypothetical protein
MAVIQTLGSYLSPAEGIAPQTISAATTGAAIDRMGYDHAVLVQNTTNMSGSPTITFALQHATTAGGTYSDYTPDFAYPNGNSSYTTAAGPAVTTNGISHWDVDLQKANRYIRVVARISGTTSAVSQVSVLLGQREGVVPG